MGVFDGALGHGARDFGADCAMRVDQLHRHAKHLVLGLIGIGDVAALENRR